MKNNMFSKSLVLGIILLFVGVGVFPVAGFMENSENVIENQIQVESKKQNDATSRADEWPMFHHDLQNTGYSTSPDAPETNNILWTFQTGFFIGSSPAIVDGRLYIGSDDEYFYCLDADTGEKIWDYPIPGGTSSTAPAVYDGKVYVGSVYYEFYCWDAETGDLIWNVSKEYGRASHPAVSDGKVYTTLNVGGSTKLFCLDADTGEKIWNHKAFNYLYGGWTSSGPAIFNGKVYFGEDKELYCLNASTGEEIWTYTTTRPIFTTPTVDDAKIYFGTWTGTDPYEGRFYCLNASTGEERWNIDIVTISTPAVAYERIYYIARNGKVYCLDAEYGDELWNYTASSYDPTYSAPAVADGKVYVGIYWGDLLCLDAFTGELIWDYQISSNHLHNSPAVAYGRIYIGGFGSYKVYCFGASNIPPEAPTLEGPTLGLVGEEYNFTVVAMDPDGDQIFYYIDWGDNTNSSWLGPYVSGEECNVTHHWTKQGHYEIKAKAKDICSAESGWSEPHIISIVDNIPPDAPAIDGPNRGKPGTTYEYDFTSVDTEEHDIAEYIVNWDDGTGEEIIFGPFVSGEEVKSNHTWDEKGTYTIKAKAKDINGAESNWSEFKVEIPRTRATVYSLFHWFLERFPLLERLLGLIRVI